MNRVPQFVTFSSIMSVSLLCIGTILASVTELSDKTGLQATLLVALLVATTAYGLGVGAVPYTMLGEVFTPRHRCHIYDNPTTSSHFSSSIQCAPTGTWARPWRSLCAAARWFSSPPWCPPSSTHLVSTSSSSSTVSCALWSQFLFGSLCPRLEGKRFFNFVPSSQRAVSARVQKTNRQRCLPVCPKHHQTHYGCRLTLPRKNQQVLKQSHPWEQR